MDWRTQKWRRIAVYGLGRSGQAAVALLRAHGISVLAFDENTEAKASLADLLRDPGVEFRSGDTLNRWPKDIDALVVSPGVPPHKALLTLARDGGLPVFSEVDLAIPLLGGPMLAITGSNGKSTTTALTGHLLEAAGFVVETCGNLGRPLCEVVEGPADRIFVVELSSFQLETSHQVNPRAAAWLNFAPDHLDWHGGVESYARAKEKIFRLQGPTQIAVLNADDPRTQEVKTLARRRLFSRSAMVGDGCHLQGEDVIEVSPQGVRPLFSLADLPLQGSHNHENAMAAFLLALSLADQREAFRKGLRSFQGLAHRLSQVGDIDGISFWNDSKATNVAATLASLQGFPDHSVHLILGGRGKGEDFSQLSSHALAKTRQVYLVGEATADLDKALDPAIARRRCGDLESAVRAARESALKGEVVLLSPACASYDQYPSFTARGRHFEALVREGKS